MKLPRRKIDPSNATLLEVAYARSGSLRKAARVMAYIAAWAVVRHELGRDPSVEEYAEHWRVPRSTAFKEQQEFREIFDRCDTPAPVLEVMEAAGGETARADFGELLPA